MHIDLDPAGRLQLADPREMTALSARVPPDRLEAFAKSLGEHGRLDGEGHVWLNPGLIRALAGPIADAGWEEALSRMLAYAGGKGWVDAAGRVRAHLQPPAATVR